MDLDGFPTVDDTGAIPAVPYPTARSLVWPPPGLEAVHGKLWPLVSLLAVGDVTLFGPLLWSVARQQEFWSLGPFGRAWWVLIVTSLLGLVILFEGAGRLFRLLRLAARSSEQGHGWVTAVLVAADSPRDTGFLMLGERWYAALPVQERRMVLVLRVVAAAAYVGAVLWVPLGFVASVMLGGRGVLGPFGVWFVTLGPALLLLVAGVAARILETLVHRSAKRDRGLRAVVDQEIRASVDLWNAGIVGLLQELGVGFGRPRGRAFRMGAWSAIVACIVIAVPVATIAVSGSIGSVMAELAVPDFSRVETTLAAAELFRPYRLEPDGSVSPREGGEALHAMLSVGVWGGARPFESQPVRTYERPWFPPDSEGVTGLNRHDWAMGLFERVGGGVSRVERDYLVRVSAHPAHEEFARLARARSADIMGTRFALPLPDTLSPMMLPPPRFAGMRDGARAHVAVAALDLLRGRADSAERRVREVISAGFVLLDEGRYVMDNLIGATLVRFGGEALENLYTATGRDGEAGALHALRSGVDEMLLRARPPGQAIDHRHALRVIPARVLSQNLSSGLRWEYLLFFTTIAPCANLNGVVFGPSDDYEQWIDQARTTLVEHPSDAALFEFSRNGWFGRDADVEGPVWLGWALRMTFGRGAGASCVARIAGIRN